MQRETAKKVTDVDSRRAWTSHIHGVGARLAGLGMVSSSGCSHSDFFSRLPWRGCVSSLVATGWYMLDLGIVLEMKKRRE